MPRLLSIALLIATLLVASSAHAQAPSPATGTAESHYQSAVRLFGEGRYGEALGEFDAAIALSPESIFFCNRAIVLIKLQEPEAALQSLETCQQTHAGDQAELAEIDAQRAAVQVMVGHVRPSVLDTVSLINAPSVAPDARSGWTWTSTGVLLMSIGGAAIASAATLDFLSKDLQQTLQARATAVIVADGDYLRRQAEYDEARKRYVDRQRIWLGLTAAGAVLTVTGATLVVSQWISSTGSTDVEVGLTPTHPGVVVRLHW